jgi:hypothetical protein
MTKEELLKQLRAFTEDDREVEHEQADHLLLDYIGDSEFTKAFLDIDRWYA